MKYFGASLTTEMLKMRKSRVFWISIIAFLIVPLMGGFFMFILKDPLNAEKIGMLGEKAKLAGEANWPSFFAFLAQAVTVGGILLFGVVTSWVFGREYSDRTAKDLLALPIPRTSIVMAKFSIVFLWCIFLSILVLLGGLLVGRIVGLPGWTSETWSHGVIVFALSTSFTIAISPPTAFFACFGRGYLAPMGFVLFMLVFAQVLGAVGYGAYFPWSIPSLYSGAGGGSAAASIGNISILILFLTGAAGAALTAAWWCFADQDY